MTGRFPFFERVDEVLSLLAAYRREKPDFGQQGNVAAQQEITLAQWQAAAWEGLVVKLLAYDVEVLEYVAAMLKTRENLIGRRMSSILGASRANGMLGVLLSAFAMATVFNFLATMWPDVPKARFVVAFFFTTALAITLGYLFLRTGHQASQLLTYVSLLEAVIALKKAEPAGLSLPLTFPSPAQVVRPGARRQVEEPAR